MARKLLRVAVVAAVIPALAPEISSAQIKPAVVPTAIVKPAPATKTGIAGWWQKVRGTNLPTAQSGPVAKIVRVSAETSVTPTVANPELPYQLEGEDVQLLRSSSRRRPTPFVQPAPEGAAPQAAVNAQTTAVGQGQVEASPAEQQPVTPAAPLTEPTPAPPPSNVEPDAFPIEAAQPPAANNGTPVTPAEEPYFKNPQPVPGDVTFNRTTPAQPTSRAMGGMNGGTPAAAGGTVVRNDGPIGYARLDGAMYPSPQPGIPAYVGSTMITNPALDPHEMLYAHQYRGLYGPFYHKTYRHWVLTPFGLCKSEKRVLIGTEVRVNYKSHISPFALFWPPVTH